MTDTGDHEHRTVNTPGGGTARVCIIDTGPGGALVQWPAGHQSYVTTDRLHPDTPTTEPAP